MEFWPFSFKYPIRIANPLASSQRSVVAKNVPGGEPRNQTVALGDCNSMHDVARNYTVPVREHLGPREGLQTQKLTARQVVDRSGDVTEFELEQAMTSLAGVHVVVIVVVNERANQEIRFRRWLGKHVKWQRNSCCKKLQNDFVKV